VQSVSTDLTLSLIQTETHWHDPLANQQLFDDWLARVPEQSTLVVLPEMFSTGFTMCSAEVAEEMSGPTVTWLIDAARSHNKTLCGSVVIADSDKYYNRFIWVTPQGEVSTYDKRHRFRMAGEHEHYAAGEERVVLKHQGFRICPMVCYDLRFPVFFRNLGDYDLLLCVANWPAARQSAWDVLLRARAIENLSYMAAVNIVGTDGNGVAYDGGSVMLDPQGQSLAEAGDRSGVVTAALSLDQLKTYRQDFPAWQDADEFSLDQ
jgi:omega-amidase